MSNYEKKSCCGVLGDFLMQKKWRLPVLLYAAVWLMALAAALCLMVMDAADRKKGVLAAEELTLADFALFNAHTESDTLLVADTEDPQLHYTVPVGKKLRSLTLAVEYNRYPGERCLYYITGPEQAFGQDRRVWPQENADGSVSFVLPRGVTAVRLDPGSTAGLTVTVNAVTANLPHGASRYLVPSAGMAFALLVLPGLAAAVLQWSVEFVLLHRKKKQK